MLPVIQRISEYNNSAGNSIKYIVLHDTGNFNDTPEGNANFFGGQNRNASAHYFVGDYSIVQVVLDSRAAWHCGDGLGIYGINNHNSLGIEMCNTSGTITDATIKNVLALVKYKMNEFNVPLAKVCRHWDASRKNCPASWSDNNWKKWYEFKELLAGAPLPIQSVPDETPVQSVLHFSYPNNAKMINNNLYVRDSNGIIVPGRYVSNGDNITVLDISYSKQLVLVEYPTPSGVRTGYVSNLSNYIQYYNQGLWRNGSTNEVVFDENGAVLGSLDPREAATPIYRKKNKLHVVYNTNKGSNTKSGYVVYNGGFSKF